MVVSRWVLVPVGIVVAACNASDNATTDGPLGDASAVSDAHDVPVGSGDGGAGMHTDVDAASNSVEAGDGASIDAAPFDAGPCSTRVTYGDNWMTPRGHVDRFDTFDGPVTWDGTCTDDGANSYALLSDGRMPHFTGHDGCVLAIDSTCPPAVACTTRVTYGATWIPAANHPASYDEVAGRVFWDGDCQTNGNESSARLSNGWLPSFMGASACNLSFRYEGCGGLYGNPVVDFNCPDPGVLADNGQYIAVCTSGGAADAYPIRTSPDLVDWTFSSGYVFPAGHKPSWASGDFWAPEVHHVGSHYVAYFSARQGNGRLAIGAATSASAEGPFTDIGAPLIADPSLGLIDASEFDDAAGNHYALWKVDGNAAGKPTPIFAQPLSADGTALTGGKTQLITNDQSWEGAVVEGPWVLHHGAYYYLFYSGNSYANASYAMGVARSANPLGPYQKASGPIIVTSAAWVGPGHGSILDLADGTTYVVYHAWRAGHVNGAGDGRFMLLDEVFWSQDGWPQVPQAPSIRFRPMP